MEYHIKTYRILSLVISLQIYIGIAKEHPLYQIATRSIHKPIISVGICTKSIGEGNNLIEHSVTYKSKCEGDGHGPKLEYETDGTPYLTFKTSGKEEAGYMPKSRTELAITDPKRPYFQFGKDYYIGFKLKIPDSSAAVAINNSFYIFQLWQCSGASPIAGLRLSPSDKYTDNSTTNINFMTRGDFSEGSTVHFNIQNDKWIHFIVKVNVNPRKGRGQLTVWKNINEVKVETNTSFGYFNKGICTKGKRPPQHFRVKFGIYKNFEKNKNFIINYSNFVVGDTFDSVIIPSENRSSFK
ncbi:heparin lyase I family protein [Paraglaciecola chathamensis]|uniref:heparin lyase I family protein n=1 Tax=Paraglaciecola chathamensis TaxID=368405 RepID=UPI002705854B|nr:heparin lyase I family protein [Paraglaciecola chathamensis]MDO6838040.1 heparin lyase I family protein [Paraglaciecola chathamensis]